MNNFFYGKTTKVPYILAKQELNFSTKQQIIFRFYVDLLVKAISFQEKSVYPVFRLDYKKNICCEMPVILC